MVKTGNPRNSIWLDPDKDSQSVSNYEVMKKQPVGYNCDQYIALPNKLPGTAFTPRSHKTP